MFSIVSIKPPTAQEAEDWQKWAQSIIQIVGGFGVGWLAHILTSRRERRGAVETRRREFLATIQAWRVEIDRWHFVIGGFERRPMVFLDGISGFKAAVEMIRRDFTVEQRTRLDELVAVLPKCNPHKTDDILKAIDDIYDYVSAA